MLLNQQQRDREAIVAWSIVDMLLANCKSCVELVPEKVIASYFAQAIQEADFFADEGSARRILHLVGGELIQRRRVVDHLNTFILTSTEEILELRKKAELEAKEAKAQARARR
jgi:hypothetical protein